MGHHLYSSGPNGVNVATDHERYNVDNVAPVIGFRYEALGFKPVVIITR